MLRGWAARWRLGEAVRAHGREGGGEGASVRASSSRALSLSSRLLPWQVAARLQRHECVGAVKQKCRGGGRRNCGTRTLDGDLPRRRKWVMSFLEALDPPSPHREKRPPPQTNGDLRSSLPTPYCGLLDPALVAVCDLSLGRVCVCARAWCASHLSLAHSLSLSPPHTLPLLARPLSKPMRCPPLPLRSRLLLAALLLVARAAGALGVASAAEPRAAEPRTSRQLQITPQEKRSQNVQKVDDALDAVKDIVPPNPFLTPP